MKKKLQIDRITNELEGASVFFATPSTTPSTPLSDPASSIRHTEQQSVTKPIPAPVSTTPRVPADQPHSFQPQSEPHQEDSKQASLLACYPDSIIETIRKAVKQTGREVAFVRLTPAEKGQLADIVYTYKRQGVKTSENEISRIAMSYLLEDYKANGQESMLAKVIASLLA